MADEFNVKLEDTLNSLNDMLQLYDEYKGRHTCREGCQDVGEKDCRGKDASSRRGGL